MPSLVMVLVADQNVCFGKNESGNSAKEDGALYWLFDILPRLLQYDLLVKCVDKK